VSQQDLLILMEKQQLPDKHSPEVPKCHAVNEQGIIFLKTT